MTPEEKAERIRAGLVAAFGPSWSSVAPEQERQLRLQIVQHKDAMKAIAARQKEDPDNADVYQARIETLAAGLDERKRWLVYVVNQELPGDDEPQVFLEGPGPAVELPGGWDDGQIQCITFPCPAWDEATGVELFTDDQLALQSEGEPDTFVEPEPGQETSDQDANLETPLERPRPVQDVAETDQVDEDTVLDVGPSTGVLGAPTADAWSVLYRTPDPGFDDVFSGPPSDFGYVEPVGPISGGGVGGSKPIPTDTDGGSPVGSGSTPDAMPVGYEPPKIAGALTLAGIAYLLFT